MTYTEKILEKKQDKLYPIARCAALMKYTVTHFIVFVNNNLQHAKKRGLLQPQYVDTSYKTVCTT